MAIVNSVNKEIEEAMVPLSRIAELTDEEIEKVKAIEQQMKEEGMSSTFLDQINVIDARIDAYEMMLSILRKEFGDERRL